MSDPALTANRYQPSTTSGWDSSTGLMGEQQEFRAAKDGDVGVAKSTESVLADAAEEMTFGAAERTNKRDLGERDLVESEGSRQIERIEKIQEMMEKLGDVDPQKIRAKIEELKLHRDFSQAALEEWAGGLHEDISYQQAALEIMAGDLEESGDQPALLEAVQTLIVKNEREFGPQIRAGTNVTPAAMSMAETSGEVQGLRDFYRSSVISYDSANQTCKNIVQTYGGDDLEGKIAFLLKGLGDDLGSRGPSVEPAQLHEIVSDLQSLKTIASAYDRVKDSMARVDQRFQVM
jgi:type III secretion protein W